MKQEVEGAKFRKLQRTMVESTEATAPSGYECRLRRKCNNKRSVLIKQCPMFFTDLLCF